MIDPLLSHAISAACALLLLLAAWHKISARERFLAALADYRLLPAVLLGPVAMLLPALEATLGLAWLAAVGTGTVAVLTAGLLVFYALAVAINLLRGRVHIDCGCGFGNATAGAQPLSWWLVARNLAVAGLALVATLPATSRALGPYDWLSLVLALLAAGLLGSAAAQLLRNGTAMLSWRTRSD